jgi:hypothetical protein
MLKTFLLYWPWPIYCTPTVERLLLLLLSQHQGIEFQFIRTCQAERTRVAGLLGTLYYSYYYNCDDGNKKN